MKKTLVVMAAGMGSRFGGLKQLNKFGADKKTLLDFAIEDAIDAGFLKLVFVIRKDIEELFRAEVSAKYEGKLEVAFAFQELNSLPQPFTCPVERTKPWGTGHAILCCEHLVKEPFLAINADDYYGKSVYKIMGDFLDKAQNGIFALAAYLLKNTLSENGGVSRGVCKSDAQGFLRGVAEHCGLKKNGEFVVDESGEKFSPDTLVSMNFWAFTPEIFKILKSYFNEFLSEKLNEPKSEFYLPLAVDKAIKESLAKVMVLPNDELWQGITYKEDISAVEKFLARAF